MAVYERGYRGYRGALTPAWSRLLVIPRYAYRDVFKQRGFLAFFVVCFILPLMCALLIYLRHNLTILEETGVDLAQAFPLTASTFQWILRIQALGLGFFLTVAVGPGLLSADLRNNALPLYLGRPFSRAEYVVGKMSVLAGLLSAITWGPLLLLFGLASYLEGWSWFRAHSEIGVAIFVGSWLWILFLCLVSLAVSAWVKLKPLAAGMLIAIFLVSGAFGGSINEIYNTRWGSLANPSLLVVTVWGTLFGVPVDGAVPTWSALTVLGALSLFSLALIRRKVQAYEVVR